MLRIRFISVRNLGLKGIKGISKDAVSIRNFDSDSLVGSDLTGHVVMMT
jgi:hypothetical protein